MHDRDKKARPEQGQKSSQGRFLVDFRRDSKNRERVLQLLEEANKKERGGEVTFKDIVAYALAKLTSKDLEAIRQNSLTGMDKVKQMLAEYNRKEGANLDLGEFLAKKLKLS